jgi:MSHA biogenesis protein MshJ
MKPALLKVGVRIDAMSLRERCLIFVAAAALLLFSLQAMLFSPLFERQKILSQRIVEQSNKISGIDAEIVKNRADQQVDPDRIARSRLQQLQQEMLQLQSAMRNVQTVLVPPDKVASTVEAVLKAHGRLRLLSLKTISANSPGMASVVQPGLAGQVSPAPAPAQGLIYRHGVQIVVRGEYPDLLAYLQALEALPTHLIWGDARLSVDGYPNSVLTLSLYTLSLDSQWMQL